MKNRRPVRERPQRRALLRLRDRLFLRRASVLLLLEQSWPRSQELRPTRIAVS
jgi:hypothetical protein